MLNLAKRYKFDIIDYLYIIVGAFITAVAFQVFLLPNNIVSGGTSGVSIITLDLFGWDPYIVQYALNIPLLAVAYLFLGKEAGNKTVLGSIILPFFIGMISHWPPVTHDQFLATIIGGAISGIGLGIIFRAKASTGGSSVPAQIIHKYTGLSLGTSSMIVDGGIMLLTFLTFEVDVIMYGVINLYVVAFAIDLVQVGFNTHKNVLIITKETEKVRWELMNSLERGVTNIQIRSSVDDSNKEMLMCVIPEREFPYMKELITSYDPEAFVVVTSASEVMGHGFSITKQFEALGHSSFVQEYDEREIKG